MFELRQIQSPDFPAVLQLFREAFEPAEPPQLAYIENLCATTPEGCFLALEDGEPVGYACSHRSGSIGYIGTVAVAKAHRGKGYGKRLTLAVRDWLAERCSVVGLEVEPSIGRNLELYCSCGFVPSLPGCFVWRQWKREELETLDESVRSAEQLGAQAAAAIRQVQAWTDEVHPGLDFTGDLTLFAEKYPDRLWFDMQAGEARGFLANEALFRGDVWGCVRPGRGDLDCFRRLVIAVESASVRNYEWFHFHSNFERLLPVLQERGYRVTGHKTCMVLAGQRGPWPSSSDSILIRPWWT